MALIATISTGGPVEFLDQGSDIVVRHIFREKLASDAEYQHRASSASTPIEARQKLAHVRRGISITFASPKTIEDGLQFIAPGNDDADAQRAQIKKEAGSY